MRTMPKDRLSARFEMFGGYGLAERQMAVFLPENICYEYTYPFQALFVHPLSVKFAEKLSHRDYLGSIMNLGLERSKFGDIIVNEDSAIVFVCDEIAGYVADSLTCVRHTSVACEKKEIADISYVPDFSEIKGTVPSVRSPARSGPGRPQLRRPALTSKLEKCSSTESRSQATAIAWNPRI